MMIPKPKRQKKSDRKKIVAKLDQLVSEIVRKRDGKCVICGTTERLTAGHLFSRVAYSIRWDLNNVFAQCSSCNYSHEFDPFPFHDWFIREYSLEDFRILHALWKQPKKFSTVELEELYEELLKSL